MSNKIKIGIHTRPVLGITTNTFMECIKSGYINVKDVIKWCRDNGFSWVEIRDPEVSISQEELKKLKLLGDSLGTRMHYAWDKIDLLKPDDNTFIRSVENAGIFGEGTHCRVVIAPMHIKNVENKKGYTIDEYKKILFKIQEYSVYAQEKGIILCFENAYEPLAGDRSTYFGMSELLDGCSIMKTTFDSANFMNKEQSRTLPTQEMILNYFKKYYKQIPYYHLKITKDNILMPRIDCEGDLDLKLMFSEFTSSPDILICLELPSQPQLETVQENILSSIGYMKSTGLMEG